MAELFNIVDPMLAIWLVLAVVFIIVEMLTVGLQSIWFAAGSIAALLVASFGGGLGFQILVFLVISIGLLFATRPFAQRFINAKAQRTNADRAIGQVIRITERVNNMDQSGRAEVHGQEWTVRSRDDSEVIEVGEFARVLEISGVKLIVEKV